MKALKLGVILMAVLLTGGFAVLGATWWKSRDGGIPTHSATSSDPASRWQTSLGLPPGSRVTTLNSESRTLDMVVTLPDGEQMIYLVRRKDGQITGEVHLHGTGTGAE